MADLRRVGGYRLGEVVTKARAHTVVKPSLLAYIQPRMSVMQKRMAV